MLATGYVAASILLSGFYLRIDDMKLAVMRGLSYLSYTKCAPQSIAAQFSLADCSYADKAATGKMAVPCPRNVIMSKSLHFTE